MRMSREKTELVLIFVGVLCLGLSLQAPVHAQSSMDEGEEDEASMVSPMDAGEESTDEQTTTDEMDADEGNEEGGNLLSEENLLDAEATSSKEGKKIEDTEGSFGTTLSAFGLEAEISGYGETVFYLDKDLVTFDLWHFVPIIGVQIGDHARAEIELEYEHGGSATAVEYAFFEYAPARYFSVRVGKINVPVGRYNAILHPSFRWNQINRPAMMDEVIPTTWSDIGLEIFGKAELGPTSSFDYNLFVTNGLGYPEGTDLTTKASFVRKLMRGNVIDNNIDKAFGGRLGLRVLAGGGKANIVSGISFYSGAVDPAGADRLTIVDFDLEVKIVDFLIRGEVAQSLWTTAVSTSIAPLERGSYLQMAYTLGKFELAVRWDNTFLKPSFGPTVLKNSIVPTIKYAPDLLWSVRAETKIPLDEAIDGMPRVDLMLSFSF